MLFKEAMKIIKDGEAASKKGFMVSFERVEGKLLISDYFPDPHAGEHLLATAQEAWQLAHQLAKGNMNKFININVVDHKFVPVVEHGEDKISNIRQLVCFSERVGQPDADLA